jgi:cell division protein FtsI/penicillin-binding protein 2
VALSIDARAQGALEDELGRGMLESNAKGAAGIILDVDTGEVIALASLPSFNPNRSDRVFNGLVFNRVSNQVYELAPRSSRSPLPPRSTPGSSPICRCAIPPGRSISAASPFTIATTSARR